MVACIQDVETVTETGDGGLTATAWEAFALAQGTVFHTARFLLPWWSDRLAKNASSRLTTVNVVADGQLIGICAFELDAGELSFAGGCDVVDYMGPAALAGREKDVAAALARWLLDSPDWARARLTGLAQDNPAAQAFTDEVLRLAPSTHAETYDQAPRIERAPQGYLALLNAKRRADVLRKRNRLIEAVGEVELVPSTHATVEASLERLLAWKAEAGAATQEFVAEYGGFVHCLLNGLTAADAGRVVELHADGRPLAAAITLTHRDTTYIYNMAYDMNLSVDGAAPAGLAPGVVLVSLLVEQALDQGMRFDFLKGAQDYKLRLGGVPVDLTGLTLER